MVLSSGALLKVLQTKSSFRDLGTKREPKRAKREAKGSKREPNGAKREPKGAKREAKGAKKGANMEPRGDQNAYKNRSSEKVSKSEPKGGARALSFGAILVQNPSKMPSKIHSKIDREKTWKIIPKGSQNGAEIDAKTNYKSADPLVGRVR